MKNQLLNSLLALVALCSAASLSAQTNLINARHLTGEIPLDQVTATTAVNGDTVTAGTARIMVRLRLGSPSAVLSDGSWLYSGYTVKHGASDAGRSGTLVVRFAGNKVTTLTVANQATVIALRSAPRHPTTNQILAANQRR